MKTKTAPVERLAYSIAESCEAAGVGRTTMFAAIRGDEIEVLRIGDRVLIEPDELRRWLSTKRRLSSKRSSAA